MSEFRKDPVSGDWIIMAPERAKRPHEFFPKKHIRKPSPVKNCPFEDLKKSGNWPLILRFPKKGEWKAVVFQNKFPALTHGPLCGELFKNGPYSCYAGIGHHDIAILKYHDKNIADAKVDDSLKLFKLIQNRYKTLIKDRCLVYTSTFFNWGESVGASIYHPHYQMLTLPIIPPDVENSLRGSEEYSKKHKRCVHCEMLAYEKRTKNRIIAENKEAIAIAPFVSRQPFEVRIFPKKHLPYFEKTSVPALKAIISILQSALLKIRKNLNDPDFNFFIHTAPIQNQRHYRYYHWHVEIIPKIAIPAGFELSTGIEINVVMPEQAAKILRK